MEWSGGGVGRLTFPDWKRQDVSGRAIRIWRSDANVPHSVLPCHRLPRVGCQIRIPKATRPFYWHAQANEQIDLYQGKLCIADPKVYEGVPKGLADVLKAGTGLMTPR